VSKSDRLRGALTGLTAAVTFFAGELAAHGHWILFVVLLVLQALVWLAVAIAEA
jgi:hypothetical protein